MKDATKYVGSGVLKEKIAVAITNEAREELRLRYLGMTTNTPEALRTLVKS